MDFKDYEVQMLMGIRISVAYFAQSFLVLRVKKNPLLSLFYIGTFAREK